MIKLTAPDGTKVDVDPGRVLRARRTIRGERENENEGAQSRVDWAITSLVREPLDEVAARVRARVPSFTALTTRDGSAIWFDAKQAVGPLPLVPSQSGEGVRSSIKIMGYRQYVTETPNQVRDVIRRAGGNPL
jgi:hypothetical protein